MLYTAHVRSLHVEEIFSIWLRGCVPRSFSGANSIYNFVLFNPCLAAFHGVIVGIGSWRVLQACPEFSRHMLFTLNGAL